MEISKYIAVTGRVNSYLEQLSNKSSNYLMPVSCTSYNYDSEGSLYDLIKYLSVALRGGAGINVNLDKFKSTSPQARDFYFFLPDDYPDIDDLTEEQRKRLLTVEEVTTYVTKLGYSYVKVNDSMEETDNVNGYLSIQESWKLLIDIETPLVIDLSLLRPKGIENKVGLVSSGAVSFLTIYEAILNHINTGDLLSLMQLCGQINEVLRRGGLFKNGIVTFTLDYNHPDIVKYLNIELKDLPGSAKKGIIVDDNLLNNNRLLKLIEIRVNDKSVMLEKKIFKVLNKLNNTIEYIIGKAKENIDVTIFEILEQLYSQVCKEIIFKHNATCLLLHGNLGQIKTFEEIPLMFKEAMTILIELWKTWKEDIGNKSTQYLDADEDKQVGLGVIGLANLLSYHGIKYFQFVEALENQLGIAHHTPTNKAKQLVQALIEGYREAAILAFEAGLERAFTLAPTQTCAYRYTDIEGNTTCKNINPPLSKRVRRSSYTMFDFSGWYYHGEVETIQSIVEEYGVELIQRLWEAWQVMMNQTGLAHCMSYDLYHLIDQKWLNYFLTSSPLVTTYYQVADKVDQSYLNKSVANTATKDFCAIDNLEGCLSCSE